MPSSTSSSRGTPDTRRTAADRPGVAQPVPERPVPVKPWSVMLAVTVALTVVLTAVWEWRMRALEVEPGDLGDSASSWAEQRRRIDSSDVQVAIVGDSRILFGTDLSRFEELTGIRPLQLAVRGSNSRPALESLAADPHFRGLAVVGIADLSYFRKRIGPLADGLERYRYESPAQQVSFHLYQALSRRLGLLDDDYRLSKLTFRLDPDLRAGVPGPYDDIWKMAQTTEDRQTWLWPRIEHDDRIRAHARKAWDYFRGPPVSAQLVAETIAATRTAVLEIRARGGDVVFVRPPSAPEVRVNEEKRLPKSRGWSALLKSADVRGIHVDDEPAMQGLILPEFSHLSRACARVFTDAYVRRLAQLTTKLTLSPSAPTALSAQDCTPPALSPQGVGHAVKIRPPPE